jgi:methyltransferase-like protein
MTAITFDTLSYANKLKAVGVPDKQAEVQAQVLSEFIDEKIATKRDILGVKEEIKNVRVEFKRDMKELEYKLTIRLGSMLVGSFVATVTTIGFLMSWMLKGIS